MDFKVKGGVYPTMITPYKDGKIDLYAVDKLVEWYWNKGCDGIFAACQSSEIAYLNLNERVMLVKRVVSKAKELASIDKNREPLMIVASGHVSDSFDAQVEELNLIANEKPDALILISNRMDIANTSDEAWIEQTAKLIEKLPTDIPLGVYECPKPYKRLLSEKMIKWCNDTGRFYFIKDTCCDASIIRRRLEIIKNGNLKIFNANAQTMLESFRDGAFGYCGVMANFHPELYSKLFKSDNDVIQGFVGLSAMLENLTYPVCAKYFLSKHEGIKMDLFARSADENAFTDYQKSCIDQFAILNKEFIKNHE